MNTTAPIVDKKLVLKQIKELQQQLDALQPHINTSTAAFGDDAGLAQRAMDLRNKLAAAQAAYGA